LLARLAIGLALRGGDTTSAARFLELLRPETSLIFLDLVDQSFVKTMRAGNSDRIG
jgi:hypothetical protein